MLTLPLGHALPLWPVSPQSTRPTPEEPLTGHLEHEVLRLQQGTQSPLSSSLRTLPLSRKELRDFTSHLVFQLGICSQGRVACVPGRLQPAPTTPRGAVSGRIGICARDATRAMCPTSALSKACTATYLFLQPETLAQTFHTCAPLTRPARGAFILVKATGTRAHGHKRASEFDSPHPAPGPRFRDPDFLHSELSHHGRLQGVGLIEGKSPRDALPQGVGGDPPIPTPHGPIIPPPNLPLGTLSREKAALCSQSLTCHGSLFGVRGGNDRN